MRDTALLPCDSDMHTLRGALVANACHRMIRSQRSTTDRLMSWIVPEIHLSQRDMLVGWWTPGLCVTFEVFIYLGVERYLF